MDHGIASYLFRPKPQELIASSPAAPVPAVGVLVPFPISTPSDPPPPGQTPAMVIMEGRVIVAAVKRNADWELLQKASASGLHEL